MRTNNGYKKFKQILEKLEIPYHDFDGNINERLDEIFSELFDS